MIVGAYAVSIQYGRGMHYFVAYAASEREARIKADQHLARCKGQWKKGAKPRVFVWQQLAEMA